MTHQHIANPSNPSTTSQEEEVVDEREGARGGRIISGITQAARRLLRECRLYSSAASREPVNVAGGEQQQWSSAVKGKDRVCQAHDDRVGAAVRGDPATEAREEVEEGGPEEPQGQGRRVQREAREPERASRSPEGGWTVVLSYHLTATLRSLLTFCVVCFGPSLTLPPTDWPWIEDAWMERLSACWWQSSERTAPYSFSGLPCRTIITLVVLYVTLEQVEDASRSTVPLLPSCSPPLPVAGPLRGAAHASGNQATLACSLLPS